MREVIKGFVFSLLIYLALPDVELTKIQVVLILIVGSMVSTAAIWKVQEITERRREYRRREEFRQFLSKITL